MTLPGKRLGAFEVWGKLGEGGMSDVWLARHEALSLPVVIKTMKPHADFEQRYTRMLDEARLTARLQSPHVVRVLDVGVYDDPRDAIGPTPYLVEEYVDGVDLSDLDARRRATMRRRLPLWAVADFVAQAAQGLHAAHQAGVVHRDVKPGNLFAYGHGSIKVGDFGVAIAAGAGPQSPAGTLCFMAPEQLLGHRIDRRADVYGLGTTAFALRYGGVPFSSIAQMIKPDAAPHFPPATTPEEAYFQHVISRMCARQPDARYEHLARVRQRMIALAQGTMPRIPHARIDADTYLVGETRIRFETGDLARAVTDAVVNSGYSDMKMRSGVGESLRRRGGDAIEAEALACGEQPLGTAVATGAGALDARAVIHAVGGWKEVSCVGRATQHALLLAEERRFSRIAVPAIGTGQGQISIESCADSMVGALRQHLALGGSHLREVRFVLYDQAAHERFRDVAIGVLLGTGDLGFIDDDETAIVGPADHESASAPTLVAPPKVSYTPTQRPSTGGDPPQKPG